jgi:hypothetical protein
MLPIESVVELYVKDLLHRIFSDFVSSFLRPENDHGGSIRQVHNIACIHLDTAAAIDCHGLLFHLVFEVISDYTIFSLS